jgi:Domain of unknown function (DUF4214)/RTX calcium-binding nonapeptide repeat (4 copies)
MAASAYYTQVQNLYVAYFGRPADKLGLEYYANLLDASKGNQTAMLHDFAASAESAALYNQTTTSGKIAAMYQTLFGHAADIDGLAYWVNQVQTGKVIMSEVAATLAFSAQTADAAIVAAKLTAAAAFTAKITTVDQLLAYENNASVGRTWLATVTSAATATTAAATIDSTLAGAVSGGSVTPGLSFTLTTAIDTITGTTGNDTIVTSDATMSSADQINGGAGTDTLKVFAAAAGTVTLGQLSNVETVFVSSGASDINVAAIAGVTGLVIDSATAARNYTVANQSITLQNDKTVQGGVLKFGATDTAANVTVSTIGTAAAGVITSGAVDVNVGTLVSTLNLTATGAADYVTLTNTAAGLKTLNVSGDKAVTVTTALAAIKTVNASTNTGGLTYDANTLSADNTLTFTGGSGNDKVIFKAATLLNTVGVADVLDGGAGTDTIVINDTAPVYAAINAAKNFEVVGLNTTGATVDVAQITNGINKFAVGSFGTTAATLAETFNNSLSTTTYAIDNTVGNLGTVAINNKVGESAVTIALDNQSGAAQTASTLTLVGATTVNLSSTGSTGSSNVITTLTNVENSNIVVTGDKALTITNALVGAVTGSKVDASGFTAALTVKGSGVSDIIIGGSGADKIVSGVGADVLTGGAGADKFIYNGTVAAVFTDSLGTTAAMDKITDFVAGTDKIALVNTGVAVTSVVLTSVAVATAADVATLLTAIGTSVAATVGGAEQVGVVTVAAGAMAGTYLLINDLTNAAANTDTLINITGVSGTLTTADFVFA